MFGLRRPTLQLAAEGLLLLPPRARISARAGAQSAGVRPFGRKTCAQGQACTSAGRWRQGRSGDQLDHHRGRVRLLHPQDHGQKLLARTVCPSWHSAGHCLAQRQRQRTSTWKCRAYRRPARGRAHQPQHQDWPPGGHASLLCPRASSAQRATRQTRGGACCTSGPCKGRSLRGQAYASQGRASCQHERREVGPRPCAGKFSRLKF